MYRTLAPDERLSTERTGFWICCENTKTVGAVCCKACNLIAYKFSKQSVHELNISQDYTRGVPRTCFGPDEMDQAVLLLQCIPTQYFGNVVHDAVGGYGYVDIERNFPRAARTIVVVRATGVWRTGAKLPDWAIPAAHDDQLGSNGAQTS